MKRCCTTNSLRISSGQQPRLRIKLKEAGMLAVSCFLHLLPLHLVLYFHHTPHVWQSANWRCFEAKNLDNYCQTIDENLEISRTLSRSPKRIQSVTWRRSLLLIAVRTRHWIFTIHAVDLVFEPFVNNFGGMKHIVGTTGNDRAAAISRKFSNTSHKHDIFVMYMFRYIYI